MHHGFAEDAQTAWHLCDAGLDLNSSTKGEDGLQNMNKLAHYVFLISKMNVNLHCEEARQTIPVRPAEKASLAHMLSISFML